MTEQTDEEMARRLLERAFNRATEAEAHAAGAIARAEKAERERDEARLLCDASLAPGPLIERAHEAEKAAGLTLAALVRLRNGVVGFLHARWQDPSSSAALAAGHGLDRLLAETADTAAMGARAIAEAIRTQRDVDTTERARLHQAIEELRTEATEWADDHPRGTDEVDYASGLLSAVHDIEEAMR